jgi:hypothetical protein
MGTKDDLEAKITDPLEFCRVLAGKLDTISVAIGMVDAEFEQQSALEDISESDDITEVPGSFADEAAVQTYLALAVPIIETRLDNIETKINALLAKLRLAGALASE